MLKLNVEAAIAAHKAWRASFQSAIDGIDAEKLFDMSITDYTKCVLGTWIYANQQESFEELEIFRAIKEVHVEFHQLAGRIFDCLEKGQADAAQLLLENQFVLVSDALILLLEEFRDNYAELIERGRSVHSMSNRAARSFFCAGTS